MSATVKKEQKEFLGTGRRKESVARVRLKPGTGNIIVNDKPATEYFSGVDQYLSDLKAPLETVSMKDSVDIRIRVNGGGKTGQSQAIAMGIARALQEMDGALRTGLKKEGHLTRDARMKERKKPGQPGARKRFQFSKR